MIYMAYSPERLEAVPKLSPSNAGKFTLMPPNIIPSNSQRNNICRKTLALL
jgi:hypothetical protein